MSKKYRTYTKEFKVEANELPVGGKDHDCVFLDRTSADGKTGCSIYAERPAQCRTWPFWSENLTSRATWEAVKRRTPCPERTRMPQCRMFAP